MNVSSDTILEIFKAVAVDYNYTVSVSDLRNYISSHNWKFKLTKKTDSGKLYDLKFQFVKGLTEDLFWDLSHIYPDDFGKFYSGDYPEYDLGDEYETEYDNWCYFLDDLQNEMRKVKYSSKELEEFKIVSDSKQLKHKNMKRIKDSDWSDIFNEVKKTVKQLDAENQPTDWQSVAERMGIDYGYFDAASDAFFKDMVDGAHEELFGDETAQMERVLSKRSDSRKQLKNNNMKRIKDDGEYTPQPDDVIIIDYTIDEWQIEDYAQSWRCSEEQAVRRWFAEIVERQYDGDISRNYIISHNPPKSIDRTPFTTTEDGNFNIYLSREYEDPYFVAVSKPDRAERLRKLGFFDKCDYESMYDFEYGNVSDSARRRVKDGVYDDSGVDGYNKFPTYRVFPSKSKIAFDNKDEAIEYAQKLSSCSGANNTYGKSRRSFLDDVYVKEYTQNNKNGVMVWSNNSISDSRMSGRSIVSRIKDSVKAKNIRQRITDAAEKYFKKDLKNLQAYRRVTDSKGKIKENVVFLIEDSDVLAVFPNTYGTASRDRDTMVCYSHNGQHGVCTYDYANTLKTADSYDALKDELTNYVGYNLTIVDSLPSETELKQNARKIRDSYKQHKRHAITDERLLARGEEIQYNGKRGTVQYALFHGKEPVVVRWQNDEGSEEFEIPYNQVGDLKIHDSEDDIDNNIDPNVEPVDNDSDIDDAEVTDNCGGKKKTKKKTADNVKRVKITKRQTKKSE